MGITKSLQWHRVLLEWARKSGTLIFEDDYDSEYRYSGRPVPALWGLDRYISTKFCSAYCYHCCQIELAFGVLDDLGLTRHYSGVYEEVATNNRL